MNFEKVVSVESSQITPQPFQYLQGMQFSDLHTCTYVCAYVCVCVCVVIVANLSLHLPTGGEICSLSLILTHFWHFAGHFVDFCLLRFWFSTCFLFSFCIFLFLIFRYLFYACCVCVCEKQRHMWRIFHFAVVCCFFSLFEEKRFSSHFEALVSLQQPQPQLLQLSSVECLNRVLFLAVFALLWWPTKTHWRETLNPAHTTYT